MSFDVSKFSGHVNSRHTNTWNKWYYGAHVGVLCPWGGPFEATVCVCVNLYTKKTEVESANASPYLGRRRQRFSAGIETFCVAYSKKI